MILKKNKGRMAYTLYCAVAMLTTLDFELNMPSAFS